MLTKTYYVYILASGRNGTLYTGVTNDLIRRVGEHKQKIGSSFTKRYGVDRLVWFEAGNSIEGAILREKQIKAGSRQRKLALIETLNPEWRDLYPDIAG